LTVVTPGVNTVPLAIEVVTVAVPQLSVAVIVGHEAIALHCVLVEYKTIGAGILVRTGAWASVTVKVNDAVDTLPLKSVAVQVTVCVPTLNTDPLWAEAVKFAEQLSNAAGVDQVTTAEHEP
jgi:hypothetical protein